MLSRVEEAALLSAAPAETRGFLEGALRNGLRLAAAASLTSEGVDLWNGVLRVPARAARSRQAGDPPRAETMRISPLYGGFLSERTRSASDDGEALFSNPGGGRYAPAQARRLVLRRASGIVGRTLSERDLRLTFASRYLEEGGSADLLRDRFGFRPAELAPLVEQPQDDRGLRLVREARWKERAARALAKLEKQDLREQSALVYAYAAGAAALERGWSHRSVQEFLRSLYRTKNPNAGYGLGREFDAFSTGVCNPPDTTYLITVTGHVGRVLLEGFRAGAVPASEVQGLVEITLAMPRCPGRPGTCLGYSDNPRDARDCVHNVNATAGWFLAEAQAAGFRHRALQKTVAEITQREAATYRSKDGTWRYSERRKKLNDYNHNAGSIQASFRLMPAVGAHAGNILMRRRDYRSWIDPLGQVRLLPFFPSYGAELLPAFDALLDDRRADPPVMLSQLALWAARAVEAVRRSARSTV